ncbi:unnamed protein product, partial [Symbiodinium pilosum]
MPVPRWESLVANLYQLQSPKVLLLMWTQNIDLRMQVQAMELFSGEARVLVLAIVMRESPDSLNVLVYKAFYLQRYGQYINSQGVKRFVGDKKGLKESG